jgi:hypothetical protein
LELIPQEVRARLVDTCRLVPTRYPAAGILDAVASPEDLAYVFELESWSNDRVSAELGVLHRVPRAEWVLGQPLATVIMAAFCHPRPDGGRFNSADRGAWYAATALETAQAEVAYHRTAELAEIGVFETRMQFRLYLADFDASFHDVRPDTAENAPYHDPGSYEASQRLGRELLERGSNGVLYRSVRRAGGDCVACFRPRLIQNLRPDAHYEFRWEDARVPVIRTM